ncbi:ribosome silencing factor [Gardnerella pickettii]|uniref:ribosome silencing factor n=1 Tax=Gardnerella TaxID=2701 RepID=UPI000E215187|nr:ribosome silencing factor [Gardnerella vaginalis]RDW96818.1 ribosome-associated protein IOJAP [Gardnerella vaginalis]
MAALESSVNAIRIAASAADRLKATNCQAFDVSNLLGITDAMLIVSASNERQVLAVSEEIEKDLYLKDNKRKPISREGLELAQWVLLDFGDFVIHIMHEEAREFYRLERLWNDCPVIDLQLPEHSESDADGDDGDDSDDGDYVDDAQNGDNQESER